MTSPAIPGAECAPVLTWTSDGWRVATPHERVALLASDLPYNATRLDGVFGPSITRQLSVHDPRDQLLIVYEAALALGASKEEAAATVLRHDGYSWVMIIVTFEPSSQCDGYEPRLREIWRTGQYPSPAHAVAALSLHVWGPK